MIEKKVGWSTAASLAVTITFGLIHWLAPGLASPPAYIVGGLATLVTFGVGYWAPHTHLPPALPKPAPDPVALRAAENERRWTEARKRGGYTGGMAAEDMAPPAKMPSGAIPPQVQPPATGTGTTAP
jgi:hypothetical protein